MPPENPSPFNPEPPKKEGAGPIVGVIIIVIVVIFGALYFWGALLNKKEQTEQLPFITGEQAPQ